MAEMEKEKNNKEEMRSEAAGGKYSFRAIMGEKHRIIFSTVDKIVPDEERSFASSLWGDHNVRLKVLQCVAVSLVPTKRM